MMNQVEINIYGELLVHSLQYVYPKLFDRIVELSEELIDECTVVDDCFTWASTSEGDDFWKYVNQGFFEKVEHLQPHLFKPFVASDDVTLNDVTF
jgi:hypothetical protein